MRNLSKVFPLLVFTMTLAFATPASAGSADDSSALPALEGCLAGAVAGGVIVGSVAAFHYKEAAQFARPAAMTSGVLCGFGATVGGLSASLAAEAPTEHELQAEEALAADQQPE